MMVFGNTLKRSSCACLTLNSINHAKILSKKPSKSNGIKKMPPIFWGKIIYIKLKLVFLLFDTILSKWKLIKFLLVII